MSCSLRKTGNRLDFYSAIAPFYDCLVGPFLRRVRKDICLAAASEKCGRILDIACGTGEQAIMLARAGLRAAGLDLSPAMLAEANKNSPHDVHYVLGTAEKMPFGPGSFDCVVISLALHEMSPGTRIGVIAGAREILKPGGRIVFFDYMRPNGFVSAFALGLLGLLEKCAGKRHFGNFVQFIRMGGLEQLVKTFSMEPVSTRLYFLGALGLVIVRLQSASEKMELSSQRQPTPSDLPFDVIRALTGR